MYLKNYEEQLQERETDTKEKQTELGLVSPTSNSMKITFYEFILTKSKTRRNKFGKTKTRKIVNYWNTISQSPFSTKIQYPNGFN